MTIVSRDYWYYTNGAYELKSTTDSNRCTTQMKRNISGPIPPNELYPLVRWIDPDSATWQDAMMASLARHHFNTQNILANYGTGKEVGFILKSKAYWVSVLKKAGIAVVIIAKVCAAVALVVITCYFLFKTWVALGKFPVSERSDIWTLVMIPYYVLVSVALVAISVAISCDWLFEIWVALREFAISESYDRVWIEILGIGSKSDKCGQDELIPEKYENDPVLRENTCPITQSPIRVPCRTPEGQLFEEAELWTWFKTRLDQQIRPICPLTRVPINLNEVHRDIDLSDKIELRLLLLKSKSV